MDDQLRRALFAAIYSEPLSRYAQSAVPRSTYSEKRKCNAGGVADTRADKNWPASPNGVQTSFGKEQSGREWS